MVKDRDLIYKMLNSLDTESNDYAIEDLKALQSSVGSLLRCLAEGRKATMLDLYMYSIVCNVTKFVLSKDFSDFYKYKGSEMYE